VDYHGSGQHSTWTNRRHLGQVRCVPCSMSAFCLNRTETTLVAHPKYRGAPKDRRYSAAEIPTMLPKCFRRKKQTRISPRSRCARSKGGLVPGRWAGRDAGGEGRSPHLVPNVGDFGSSAFAVDKLRRCKVSCSNHVRSDPYFKQTCRRHILKFLADAVSSMHEPLSNNGFGRQVLRCYRVYSIAASRSVGHAFIIITLRVSGWVTSQFAS
jgi:hypothetical protein